MIPILGDGPDRPRLHRSDILTLLPMSFYHRGAALLFLASALFIPNSPAQAPPAAPPTIPLWSGPVPGVQGTADIDIPKLLIFAAKNQVTTGTAVVICPGGG